MAGQVDRARGPVQREPADQWISAACAGVLGLGFEVDPMFADQSDMELIRISEYIYVMLTEPRFVSISRKKLVDTANQAEAVLQFHEPNNSPPICGRRTPAGGYRAINIG